MYKPSSPTMAGRETNKNIEKITFIDWYEDISREQDTKLVNINAVIPENVRDTINEVYDRCIADGKYDFTLDEYYGVFLVQGLIFKKSFNDVFKMNGD